MADVEDDGANTKMHVVVFPWLGFSHIINFFALSKFIAQKGHRVSFVTTPKNILRLSKMSLPQCLSSLITFVQFSMPRVEGLAENAEDPAEIGRGEIMLLMKAFDGLQPELTRFLEADSPDWIIYDMTVYWLPPLAAKLGIPCVYFRSGNAWYPCFVGSSSESMINGSDVRKTMEDWLVPPPWIPFPTKIAFRPYEARRWIRPAQAGSVTVPPTSRNPGADHDVSWGARVGFANRGADVIFIRHSTEFEPQWLNLLETLFKKPVIPVGLMPPSVQDNRDRDNDDSWLPIKEWLDAQAEKSVVYVALGTEIVLSRDQLTELALGLELSGLPFFWTLKRKMHEPVGLPDGFLERTTKDGGPGMVWTSWAPQLKILGHASVGGFLTHCGNGSMVEGMMFGHPFIMLPFYVDQGPNAKILVDNKLGVEVPRDEEDGSFTRKGIAESIRKVMVEDEGKIYKERAKEISEINGDRELQNKYIENAVHYLETHRNNKMGKKV